MSKLLVPNSKKLIQNSAIGAVLALVSYVVLQLPVALFIHCEVWGEEMLYLSVCIAATVASFLGCASSVMRGGEGGMLSVSAVVLVFLALTVVVGLLSGEAGTIGAGLTGVGGAMAVGGLLAGILPSWKGKKRRRDNSREKRRNRRR